MLHAVKLSAIRIAVFAIQPRASLPLLPFRSLQSPAKWKKAPAPPSAPQAKGLGGKRRL